MGPVVVVVTVVVVVAVVVVAVVVVVGMWCYEVLVMWARKISVDGDKGYLECGGGGSANGVVTEVVGS